MCVHEIYIFKCPTKSGRLVEHKLKTNNLCAKLARCEPGHWDQCIRNVSAPCLNCAGWSHYSPFEGIESLPGSYGLAAREEPTSAFRPAGRQFPLDLARKWADEYLDDWAGWVDAIFLEMMGPSARENLEEVDTEQGDTRSEVLRRLAMDCVFKLQPEIMCREHRHEPYCACPAQGGWERAFNYNPASGLRMSRYDTSHKAVDQALTAIKNADRTLSHLDLDDRREYTKDLAASQFMLNHAYFRDGRNRQPLLSDLSRTWRNDLFYGELDKVHRGLRLEVQHAWGDRQTDDRKRVEDKLRRRREVLELMGSCIVEDVGLSDWRAHRVLERLPQYMHDNMARQPANFGQRMGMSGLMWKVLHFQDSLTRVTAITGELKQLKEEKFARRLLRWKHYQGAWQELEKHTETLSAKGVQDVKDKNRWLNIPWWECPICDQTYFSGHPEAEPAGTGPPPYGSRSDSPSLRYQPDRRRRLSELTVPEDGTAEDAIKAAEPENFEETLCTDLSELKSGEIPVLLRCSHIIGKRCLFHRWAQEFLPAEEFHAKEMLSHSSPEYSWTHAESRDLLRCPACPWEMGTLKSRP